MYYFMLEITIVVDGKSGPHCQITTSEIHRLTEQLKKKSYTTENLNKRS